jgi:hypothetical protein
VSGNQRATPGGQAAPAGRTATAGNIATGGNAAAGGSPGAAGPSGEPAAGPDRAVVRQFIERFTGQLTQAGFPRTPARIFVALLTADSSSLTAAQLAELLQASPASVSGGARYLLQVGLISAEGEPGSRRQHYRMPATVWQDIVGLRDQMFARWAADLRDGIAILGSGSPAGQRMAETIRYFEFLQAEMAGLLARWQQQEPDG